jgi:hypothetical protein
VDKVEVLSNGNKSKKGLKTSSKKKGKKTRRRQKQTPPACYLSGEVNGRRPVVGKREVEE